MTALLLAPVVLVLLLAVVWPYLFGTADEDAYCSRVDRELDERENLRRCIGGWRL